MASLDMSAFMSVVCVTQARTRTLRDEGGEVGGGLANAEQRCHGLAVSKRRPARDHLHSRAADTPEMITVARAHAGDRGPLYHMSDLRP